MALPIVAVIGRPNVGKSTLANRFAGDNQAIVFDEPGITRDRTYRNAFWGERDFLIVDTGGLVFDDETEFLPLIRQQALLALDEAVAAVMVVDGQAGVTEADREIANWLRKQTKPVILAVNKCESVELGLSLAAEFWELGLGNPFPVSSIHGSGTGDLLDELLTHFPAPADLPDDPEINVAIIGRPNVGKSSLLNAFVGEKRAIVSPISGTTRDTIDTRVEYEGVRYRLIDTAGIRRKKSINYGPEFFSINRAFKAIKRSDVVLMVIDAQDGVTEQDQKLADRVISEGRACVIVVNKWDTIEKDSSTIYSFERNLKSKLYFMDWASMIFVSALTGQRVPKIFELIHQGWEQHRRRVTTSTINEIIEEAVRWHSPPTSRQGKQGRIYYGTQVSSQPPSIALFVNDPKRFKDNYRRYIEGQIRSNLGFEGTPVRLFWRGKRPRDVVEPSLNRATR